MLKKVFAVSLIASASILSGCASNMGMGNPEFGCAGFPEGVQCLSTKDVYNLTEQPGPITAEDARRARGEMNQPGNAQNRQMSVRDRAIEGHSNVLSQSPISSEPVPIRTRSHVLRIWVAPWESTDGDLHVSGLVFTELEQRRWNIGIREESSTPRITPLQPPRPASQ